MKVRSSESLALTLDRKTERDAETGCLIWTGATGKGGRTSISLTSRRGGAQTSAPRLAWTLKNGKIPEGHIVARRATCQNPACVEPAHFELMEGERGNVAATAAKLRVSTIPPYEEVIGGIKARKTHCKRGHEYTPENTLIQRRSGGGYGRSCRACRKQYKANRSKQTGLAA
jgi:hypothetical protein